MTITTRDAFEAWFTKARGYATTCKTADGGFEWVAASEEWEAWQAATLAAKRQPLSNEQLYEMYNEPRSDAEIIAFARAIEAAHGIKA